ncbi:3'(2'),5'-bisphosphate nucleotidase CysQ family protein [Salinarimonas soli]|uniref:3'(2'),5'-bisphosphate nucleotidase CysQ n=1 Tax=Salinarimonas soli TaxID=1638099 RepID=A0A5B2VBP0_9HYPH|nr:3'(2'),5'-bisphosphate nucleotidase CysQ [Salinarimonas soli]KAA2235709.1 3'(2'),5'-bisphosphate nucleotidase CysQ [Salinarimonas soli]
MRTDPPGLAETAERLSLIALAAGDLVRRMQGTVKGRLKSDGSPTSRADLAAEAAILAGLREAWPDIPVVAEETACTAGCGALFFLADPLDGTKCYLAGEPEFTVNIALVREGRPVAGVIVAPALGRAWRAGADAREARFAPGDPASGLAWRPVRTRPTPGDGVVALVSKRHGDAASEAAIAALPQPRRRTASSAVKFGLIAAGEADVYVRCGRTMEWDTAAGDAIVTAAGGRVIGSDGQPLTYGHRGRGYANGCFAALGDPALAGHLRLPDTCAIA